MNIRKFTSNLSVEQLFRLSNTVLYDDKGYRVQVVRREGVFAYKTDEYKSPDVLKRISISSLPEEIKEQVRENLIKEMI